jgi:biopolymer transport protein ExbD
MRYQPNAFALEQPISEINSTPLIDVMLVLLVMLLLSLPMATHKLPVELPGAGAAAGPPPPVHRLTLDARGTASWDGIPVTGAELGEKLSAFVADPARPVLQMQADAATPYVRFDETLGAVRRAGVETLGFAGNDAFRGL